MLERSCGLLVQGTAYVQINECALMLQQEVYEFLIVNLSLPQNIQ